MTYYPMGAISASDFTTAGGVCRATNRLALDKFVDLQNQINRGLHAIKRPLIQIDGEIGPATVAALRTITGSNAPTCQVVASGAESFLTMVKTFADLKGAPVSVSAPPAPKPPAFVDTATGATIAVPSLASGSSLSFGGLGIVPMVALGAIALGAGYLLLTPSSKPKRSR